MELTASMVRCFKQCPRRYELEYVHCLKPTVPQAALAMGSSYHERVAAILMRQPWDRSGVVGAMAEAFDLGVSWYTWAIQDVEREFRVKVGRGLWLKGKMDVLLRDGTPVEHKTFGGSDWDRYVDHLAWDDQVTLYLMATGAHKTIYTVCRKPTIRKRKDEKQTGNIL